MGDAMMLATKGSEPKSLLARLDKHFVACAAAAAGVGMVADEAAAAINYSGPLNFAVNTTTSAGIYINVQTFGIAVSAAADPAWNLNLFNLSYGSGNYTAVSFYPNGAHAGPTDAVIGVGANPGRIAKLAAGAAIGPAGPIMPLNSNGIGAFNLWDSAGTPINPAYLFQWLDDGSTGFMGFRANLGGSTHFGWARIQMNPWQPGIGPTLPGPPPVVTGAVAITLIDMAWEGTPNTAISAGDVPEPTTAVALGMLALGAVGIRPRRKN
jgi:hypothetical protein